MLRFIEPCLPSPAERPPSGSNWIHEIKHDGYRLMARCDPVGIRLITRRGNDWTTGFPLVVEAVNHLKVRSCLIDGEVFGLLALGHRGDFGETCFYNRTWRHRPAYSDSAHWSILASETAFMRRMSALT